MRRMMVSLGAAVGAVLLASAASGSAGSVRAGWVIRDLGTLGGKSSEATAISERGQVVGRSSTRGCKWDHGDHAFLWENGKMRDLGSKYGQSYATAISENGQVIGMDEPIFCDGSSFMFWASFVWRAGKRITLDELVGPEDINDRGQVVGVTWGEGDASTAFLLRGGKMTLLDHSPRASGAADINELGQVVGVSGANAVLWEGGKMRKLGILPGKRRSVAVAVNERGQVIGFSYIRQEPPQRRTVLDGQAAYGARAFLWEDGKLQGLGTLPGETYSRPIAINDRGQVIGDSESGAFVWESGSMTGLPSSSVSALNDRGQIVGTSNGRAFVWESGTMTELPALSGRFRSSAATAINDHGQIVGWATTKDGVHHAVLWTFRTG